jgi:xanthine dehydrogenase accessory factor
MIERGRIVALATQMGNAAGTLVTLIRAEGSSYRKPGARLLTVNGEYAGTISGGCLEAEVIRKAAWAVRSGAAIERYSTAFEDTSDIPFGLGCGGTVDLLMEPSNTPEFAALFKALEASLEGKESRVLTFLPNQGSPLRRAVLMAGEVVFRSHSLGSPSIEAVLAGDIKDVFSETLLAPQRLVVFGAGDDAQPLVRMASLLGWTVIVVDGRKQLTKMERFPGARQVLAVSAGRLSEVSITPADAVVLMTHSYEQDRDWLAAVLPVAPRYLGILGARHRSSLLVREVSAAIGLSIAECCARIFAPVGLDLGGDGPEAIALAVMAEAHACCMDRLAGSRRLLADDVLTQTLHGDASQYTLAQCALEISAD